jgi:hypothetical protein
MTGSLPDCRPQPGQTSPALGWSVKAVKPSGRDGSAGWRRSQTSDKKYVKKYVKTSFEVMSKVQKDSQDVSAGKKKKKKKLLLFEVKVGEINLDLTRSNKG